MLLNTWQIWQKVLDSVMGGVPARTRRRNERVRPAPSAPEVETLECRVVPTPTVLAIDLNPPSGGSGNVTSVSYAVSFDNAVTGVDASDFRLVTSGSVRTAPAINVFQVDPSNYTVTITGLQGSGDLQLNLVDDDSIDDGIGPLGGPGLSNGSFEGDTYNLLQTLPSVVSIDRTSPPGPNTGSSTVRYTVTFSTPVLGVDSNDFQLVFTGGLSTANLPGVSGGGTTYTVDVTGLTGLGTVGLNLVDNRTIRDLQGNPLTSSDFAPNFQTPQSINTGTTPTAMALADVNGDGHADLATTTQFGNQVSVALGVGNGTFQAPQFFNVGSGARGIAIDDVNGDGRPDLVVVNRASNTVGVLIGNGNGVFQDHVGYAVGQDPSAVAILDVNGDGFQDLIVSNELSNDVSVLFGLGTAVFVPGPVIPAGNAPSAVAVEDVTGDQIPDLIVTNKTDNTVLLRTGVGNGNFINPQLFATDQAPSALVLADFDGDGDRDIVTANKGFNTLSVLLAKGGGSFDPQQLHGAGSGMNSVVVGDVNGDGRLDLIVANQNDNTVGVLTGVGDGTFKAHQPFVTGAGPGTALIADLDKDGLMDVVSSITGGSGANYLRNLIRGDFTGQVYTRTANSDPVITSGNAVNVNENVSTSIVVMDVNATDPDLPVQTLNYSLTGIDSAKFSIDLLTGEIRFLASPDFESATDADNDNTYVATVTVDDGNGGSVIQAIAITVLGLNDNAPIITSPASIGVDENTVASTVVLDVNATDADLPGDTLTYVLTGADASKFSINAGTGQIRFLASPDYEAFADQDHDNVYDLIVTVDDGNGSTDTQSIAITVLPVSDNPPVVTSLGAVSVNENTSAATIVLTNTATDADLPAETLNFDLSGDDVGLFSFSAATRQVRFLVSPDFELPADADGNNKYELKITVSDGMGGTTFQDITITVLPLNDNPPVFLPPLAVAVNENTSTSTVVLTAVAVDADLPGDTITYSLSGPDKDRFVLNAATGEIRFVVSPDYEVPADVGANNIYDVTVTADDGQGASTLQDFTITVLPQNDNAPQITSGNTFNVNENFSTTTAVLNVIATDADRPIQNLNYSIGGADSDRFTIDTTGTVKFKVSPDYELPDDAGTNHVYNVTVFVSDSDGLGTPQDITITVLPVNDNTPIISSIAAVVVNENSSTSTVILDVNATDADLPPQTLAYSLSGDDALQFTIDTATGEIRFIGSPDFEGAADADTDNDYRVVVTVDAGVGDTTVQDITITVADVNEPPSAKDGILEPLEDTATSGTLLATDPDAGTTLNFSVAAPPLHGSVTIDNPLTGAYTYQPNLDYNGTDSFTFRAQDGTNTSNIATVSITVLPVNDAPVFNKGADQTVVEDVLAQTVPAWATGIAAGPVSAIDEAGQALAFTVTNDNNALFSTQPAIDVAGNLTYELALNANGVATVTVFLVDKGGTVNGGNDTSPSQTFTISVTAVNDAPVVTDATFVVRENAGVGAVVNTVTVIDPDPGDSKFFSITSGDPTGTFAIHPTTGQITVNNPAAIRADPHPTFNLVVKVTDGSNESATANITINVVDALVIIPSGPIQTYVKSAGAVAIDPSLVARDALVPQINYNEGRLTVSIDSPQSGDRLGVFTRGTGPGLISVLHGHIVYQSSLVIIGTIVSGQNGGPLVINFTSFATEAAVDALLQNIWFKNTSNGLRPGSRTINFDLTDRTGEEHDTKTVQLNVAASTAAPVIEFPGETLFYTDKTPAVALDPETRVTDADSPDFNGGRLTVAVVQGVSRKQRLSILQQAGGITVSGKDVSFNGQLIGRLTLKQNSLVVDFNSAAATPAAVEAFMRCIAFSSNLNNRNHASLIFQYTLSDGDGGSRTTQKAVVVAPAH